MRLLSLCFAGLASCSLIFPRLLPPACSEGAPNFCRGNEIVSCESGFEVGSPCGAGEECNEATGEAICVEPICGDAIVNNNEDCDDGNNTNNDGCEANCTLSCGEGTGAQSAFLGPNEHCYLGFIEGAPISWQAAEAQCESLGGYLVTIDGDAENALARNVLPQGELNPWIGLNDLDNEEDLSDGVAGDQFVWVNQQPNSFRAFGDGEPNNDGEEDCVHFFLETFEWNDNLCSGDSDGVNSLGFICELEPVPCGDHVQQAAIGETCDDGNAIDGDGCDQSCQFEAGVCGNGVVEDGEGCEDGNADPGDGCDQCQNEPGHFFEIEPNDDGNPSRPGNPDSDPELEGNDFDAAQVNVLPGADLLIHGSIGVFGDEDYYSLTNTTNAPLTLLAQVFVGGLGQCADGKDPALNIRIPNDSNVIVSDDEGLVFCPVKQVTIPAGETLIFGVVEFAEDDTVDYLFSLSTCGDGLQVAAEQCDDGNNIEGDGCDSNCLVSACGNNIKDASEGCDDGNFFDGDGCTSQCIAEVCGDGVVNNQNSEQCDDGNTTNGDGCDASCQVEVATICDQATAINLGDTQGDNSNGTAGFFAAVGQPDLDCFPGDGEGREDLFTLLAATDGVMTVSVTSQVDLVLYARSNCVDPNSELGCADFLFDGTEVISFPVAGGDSITIFVDGFGFNNFEEGPYTLTVAIN